MNYRNGGYLINFLASFQNLEKEDFYVSLVRGFKPAENYLNKYRFNPCGALLAHIGERLIDFDERAYDVNIKKLMVLYYYLIIQIAVNEFKKAGIYIPGHLIQKRAFWYDIFH